MALFNITRYSPTEDNDGTGSKVQDAGNDILKRLHQAAALKRKSLENVDSLKERSDNPTKGQKRKDTRETPSPKKKKKKEIKTPESSEKSKKKAKHKTEKLSTTEITEKSKKKSKQNANKSTTESPSTKRTSKKDKSEQSKRHTIKLSKKESISDSEYEQDSNESDSSDSDTESKNESHKTTTKKLADETKKSSRKNQAKVEGSETDSSTTDGEDSEAHEHDVDDKDETIDEELNEEEKEEEEREEGGQSHQDVGGFTVIGDVRQQKTAKVQRMLPYWLSHPSVVTDDIRKNCTPLEDVQGLDSDLLEKLRQNKIVDFFPVQSQLLPVLLQSTPSHFMFGDAGYRVPDICCSAPTGSGKTLAYVLPIVQCLRQRVVPQVRVLVVLPVRDLVTQVFKVFQTYCTGTKLKVGQITGKRTLASEQQMLVRKGPRGYHSNIDILVSTPGRLVDHINNTAGFSLKHLRFLVIDEADRMMDEIQQDWLSHVESAVYADPSMGGRNSLEVEEKVIYGDILRRAPGPVTANSMSVPTIPFQKLLFSATLSQNPEKLQTLNLFQPKLFTAVVGESDMTGPSDTSLAEKQGEFIGKYTTPAGLTEYYAESNAGGKPLMMFYFIEHLKFRHILCFTNSVEATHRLYWLIKLTCNVSVREFSSSQKADKRSRVLKQFAEGKIDVLICSDAMARGMDIENVQYVISYEMPPYLKTYIHRVGRTARGGKAGTAVTLLEKKEIFHFKKMLKEAGKSGTKELKVKNDDMQPYIPEYQEALKQLQDILESESNR